MNSTNVAAVSMNLFKPYCASSSALQLLITFRLSIHKTIRATRSSIHKTICTIGLPIHKTIRTIYHQIISVTDRLLPKYMELDAIDI